MHIFERHITSLRPQALAVLAANRVRAPHRSLGLSDRRAATFNVDEVLAMLAILDCVEPNLRPKSATDRCAHTRVSRGAAWGGNQFG